MCFFFELFWAFGRVRQWQDFQVCRQKRDSFPARGTSGAAAAVDLHVGEPTEDDGHVLAEVEHVDAAHLLRGATGLALRLESL